jgi:hypothetical protein
MAQQAASISPAFYLEEDPNRPYLLDPDFFITAGIGLANSG